MASKDRLTRDQLNRVADYGLGTIRPPMFPQGHPLRAISLLHANEFKNEFVSGMMRVFCGCPPEVAYRTAHDTLER